MTVFPETLEDEVEPFRLRCEHSRRTRRGRMVTVGASRVLKIAMPERDDTPQRRLFWFRRGQKRALPGHAVLVRRSMCPRRVVNDSGIGLWLAEGHVVSYGSMRIARRGSARSNGRREFVIGSHNKDADVSAGLSGLC